MYTFICEFVDVFECRPQLFNCTRALKNKISFVELSCRRAVLEKNH